MRGTWVGAAGLVLLAVLAAVWMGGCSHSGSPAPTTSAPSGGAPQVAGLLAAGQVVLPMGFVPTASALSVVTGAANVPVALSNNAGSFIAAVAASGPTLALLATDDDRLVLMGFISPGGRNVLDASSTAAALLFIELGGFTLTSDQQALARDLIASDPALLPVVAAVQFALSKNAGALTAGDPDVAAALDTAQQQILARSVPAGGPDGVSSPQAIPGTPSIDPPSAQSGVTLSAASNGDITATNTFRRFQAELYTVKAGTVDFDGKQMSVTPASPAPALTPVVLSTVAAVELTVSALVALILDPKFISTMATIPASSIAADTASKTTQYKVVMVSPFIGPRADLGPLTDPAVAPFADFFKERLQELQTRVLIFEVVFGVVDLVLGEAIDQTLLKLKNSGVIDNVTKELGSAILGLVSSNGVTVAQFLAQGAIGDAASLTLSELAKLGSPALRVTVAAAVEVAKDAALEGTAERAVSILANANAVLNATNKALMVIDKARVFGDLAQCSPFSSWNVQVKRNPLTGTVQGPLTKTFTPNFCGATSSVMGSVALTFGTLSDPTAATGTVPVNVSITRDSIDCTTCNDTQSQVGAALTGNYTDFGASVTIGISNVQAKADGNTLTFQDVQMVTGCNGAVAQQRTATLTR